MVWIAGFRKGVEAVGTVVSWWVSDGLVGFVFGL